MTIELGVAMTAAGMLLGAGISYGMAMGRISALEKLIHAWRDADDQRWTEVTRRMDYLTARLDNIDRAR